MHTLTLTLIEEHQKVTSFRQMANMNMLNCHRNLRLQYEYNSVMIYTCTAYWLVSNNILPGSHL